MIIEKSRVEDLPALRTLWMDAFGDSEEFWRKFLANAAPLTHCFLARLEDMVAGALYWFDCLWEGKKLAYLYGVATLSPYRGQGVCRALMETTHTLLREQGYAGCILHPGGPELFPFYEKLGYVNCTSIREFPCRAGAPIPLRQLTGEEYATLRRQYLPQGGVIQEKETLALLGAMSRFYAGDNCLLVCGAEKEQLHISELLGDENAAPGVLAALGYQQGKCRVPGEGAPFTMYCALNGDPDMPKYFGLAMD